LLDEYDFEKKFITYVRNENANLNVMISKQKSMVNHELFHLDENFHANMGKQKRKKL
jgi:hypothetical protein